MVYWNMPGRIPGLSKSKYIGEYYFAQLYSSLLYLFCFLIPPSKFIAVFYSYSEPSRKCFWQCSKTCFDYY